MNDATLASSHHPTVYPLLRLQTLALWHFSYKEPGWALQNFGLAEALMARH